MKVTTKFDYGEKMFYMNNNKVEYGTTTEISYVINWWERKFGGKLYLTHIWWMSNWREEFEFTWRL